MSRVRFVLLVFSTAIPAYGQRNVEVNKPLPPVGFLMQDTGIPFGGNFIPAIRNEGNPLQTGRPLLIHTAGHTFTATEFPRFIDQQIKVMQSEFKLDAVSVRRLRVAGKGVLYRSGLKPVARPPKPKADQMIILWGIEPLVDKTAEFRVRLHKSKIWSATLRRVLTEKQRTLWHDHHVSPHIAIMKELRPPTLEVPKTKRVR